MSNRAPEPFSDAPFVERRSRRPAWLWPLVAGIATAILVIVLIALFPGKPKLAAPPSTSHKLQAASVDSSTAPAGSTAKPSPVVVKKNRKGQK